VFGHIPSCLETRIDCGDPWREEPASPASEGRWINAAAGDLLELLVTKLGGRGQRHSTGGFVPVACAELETGTRRKTDQTGQIPDVPDLPLHRRIAIDSVYKRFRLLSRHVDAFPADMIAAVAAVVVVFEPRYQ